MSWQLNEAVHPVVAAGRLVDAANRRQPAARGDAAVVAARAAALAAAVAAHAAEVAAAVELAAAAALACNDGASHRKCVHERPGRCCAARTLAGLFARRAGAAILASRAERTFSDE